LWRNNAYVLSGPTRVFYGLRPVVGPPLVMGPREAVAGANVLGARVLVPVHDAHADDPLSLIFRRHGSGEDAKALAATASSGLEVVCLPPGERWEYEAPARSA